MPYAKKEDKLRKDAEYRSTHREYFRVYAKKYYSENRVAMIAKIVEARRRGKALDNLEKGSIVVA